MNERRSMKQQKTWQQKTADYRKAAVVEILNRKDRETEQQAIRRVSRKYNGRSLSGGKYLRLSAPTMRRLWYAWKKAPADSVFELHFSPSPCQPTFRPWVCRLFIEYAIGRGLTVSQAYAALKAETPSFPFSIRTVRRHLKRGDLDRINRAPVLRGRIMNLKQELETITKGAGQ